MSIKNGENKGSRVSSKLVCIKELLLCGGETERNAALELRYRDMFSPIFKGVAVVLSYMQFSVFLFPNSGSMFVDKFHYEYMIRGIPN